MGSETVTTSMLCSLPIFSDLTDPHVGPRPGITTIRCGGNQEIFTKVATATHRPGRKSSRLRCTSPGSSFLTVEPNDALGWSSVSDVSETHPHRAGRMLRQTPRHIDAGKLQAAASWIPCSGTRRCAT